VAIKKDCTAGSFNIYLNIIMNKIALRSDGWMAKTKHDVETTLRFIELCKTQSEHNTILKYPGKGPKRSASRFLLEAAIEKLERNKKNKFTRTWLLSIV
jgi:hypothetical protein